MRIVHASAVLLALLLAVPGSGQASFTSQYPGTTRTPPNGVTSEQATVTA